MKGCLRLKIICLTRSVYKILDVSISPSHFICHMLPVTNLDTFLITRKKHLNVWTSVWESSRDHKVNLRGHRIINKMEGNERWKLSNTTCQIQRTFKKKYLVSAFDVFFSESTDWETANENQKDDMRLQKVPAGLKLGVHSQCLELLGHQVALSFGLCLNFLQLIDTPCFHTKCDTVQRKSIYYIVLMMPPI